MIKPWKQWLVSATMVAALAACGGSNDDDDTPEVEATPTGLSLSLLGRYASGQFDVSAAEITAFDAASRRGFVVNALSGTLDVLNMSTPATPTLISSIDANAIAPGAEINSVATSGGIVAVAIQAAVKTDPGFVAFYRASDLSLIDSVQVGALPDMLIFTPDGDTVLVANEAEPSDDYQVDPVGSVSVIDVSDLTDITVRTAGFESFNAQAAALRTAGVRIFGPGATVAQDLEPEYIAVSADSTTAWAVLQENNALARIDIASATVTAITPLGFKDHGIGVNAFGSRNDLDVSDRDGGINIRFWGGVRGLYHPDAIQAYTAGGETYIVTANEGDARAWGEDNQAYWDGDASQGFVEEFRVTHLVHPSGFDRRAGDDLPPQLRALAAGALLNPTTFAYCGATAGNAGNCRNDAQLGRLIVTWTEGYRRNPDGSPVLFTAAGVEDAVAGDRLMYDQLYSFGSRSFSIRNAAGDLVFDSGDMIEQYLASAACMAGPGRNIPCRNFFNTGHDEGDALDSRSDAKGPEPEGMTIGTIGAKTFLFLGLERMGGVMVFDITDPEAPFFVDYLNTREDFATEDPSTILSTVGDLGPEGLSFIPAAQSPSGQPLLMIGNEVSGTTAIYRLNLTF